ncbi:MAG: tetratricopeptide repeat protein [Deltaproteobacteria bacterium]|nr:MAG: tetratricopeptide repeat protein [Deltaproteobacteria bacterium]
MRRYSNTHFLPLFLILFFLCISPVSAGVETEEPEKSTLGAEERLLGFARSLYQDELYELASAELQGFLERYPESTFKEEALVLLAKSHYLSGSHSQANEDLLEILTEYPQSIYREEVLFYLGESFFGLKDINQAINYYDRLLSEFPKSAFKKLILDRKKQILYQQAVGLLESKDYPEALEKFRQVQKDPSPEIPVDELQLRLGDTYFQLKKHKQAGESYRELISSFPGSTLLPKAEFQLALIEYRNRKFDEAAEQFGAFIEKNPESLLVPRAHYSILWALYHQKKFREAYQYGIDNNLLEDYELPWEEPLLKAKILLTEKKYQEAREVLREILAASGGLEEPSTDNIPLETLWLLAEAYEGLGLPEEEIEIYQRISREAPDGEDIFRALLSLGKSYLSRDKYPEAISVFKDILARDPHGSYSSEAQFLLGNSYYELKERESAYSSYQDLLRNFPESRYCLEAYFRLAEIELFGGKPADALIRLEEIRERFPKSPFAREALYLSIDGYLQEEKFSQAQEALESFSAAYPEDPRSDRLKFRQGEIYYSQSEYSRGIAAFEEFLKQDPPEEMKPETRFQVAWGYLKTGEYERSLSELSSIIQSYPESPTVERAFFWQGWILFQQEKYPESAELLGRLIEQYPRSELRPLSLWFLALGSHSQGEPDRAFSFFTELRALSPEENFPVWKKIKEYCQAKEDYQGLLELSGMFWESNPDQELTAVRQLERARGYLDKDNYQGALKVLRKLSLLHLPPSLQEEMLFLLAKSYRLGEITELGLRATERLLKLFPEGRYATEGLILEAEIYRQDGDYRRALDRLNQIQYEVTDKSASGGKDSVLEAKALFMLGDCYLKLFQEDMAQESFIRVIDDYPFVEGMELDRLQIGLFFQKKKRYDDALKAFSQVVEGSRLPQFQAEAQYWIGECYELQEELDQAVLEYLKVTYLHPESEDWAITARYKAGIICEKLGRYEEAVTLLKMVAEDANEDSRAKFARERVKEVEKRLEEEKAGKEKE